MFTQPSRPLPRHILSRLALCLPLGLATACVAPQAQVTKTFTTEQSFGTSLPALQMFSGEAPPLGARSNAELARDFLDLEFRMESGRALSVLTRFEGPITIRMTGDVPATAPAELARLITRYRTEGGLDVRQVGAGEAASITVDFHPQRELRASVPNAACFTVPRVKSFDEYRANRNKAEVDWTSVVVRTNSAAFIPSDTSPQEVRDCLHEEVSQAMGPLNDLYRLPDSIFNDDNFNSVLTSFDMLMLKLHYAPELKSGMNEAEVAKRLPAILARIHPQGVGGTAQALPPSPRVWINAVLDTFGGGGSAAGHAASAQRMLSIAMAQGWHDGRLAFSYFAVGRTSVATNPQAAVKAFAEAARIYRASPTMAIHAAHCDMQLAAIALGAGQNEQAIAFVDRALPAMAAGQNASGLTTLYLIKANALANLGQEAAAQSARLDSLGWARYGFGSEQQMRARTAEIAQLAARGRRS